MIVACGIDIRFRLLPLFPTWWKRYISVQSPEVMAPQCPELSSIPFNVFEILREIAACIAIFRGTLFQVSDEIDSSYHRSNEREFNIITSTNQKRSRLTISFCLRSLARNGRAPSTLAEQGISSQKLDLEMDASHSSPFLSGLHVLVRHAEGIRNTYQ